MQQLQKLIVLFSKDHPNKPIAIFLPINFALLIARPTIKPTKPIKQKEGQLANNANKQAKKNGIFYSFSRVTFL